MRRLTPFLLGLLLSLSAHAGFLVSPFTFAVPYTTTAIDHDGSTNYGNWSVSNIAPDGRKGTVVVSFRRDAIGSKYILDANGFSVQWDTLNKFRINAITSGGGTLISRSSTPAYSTTGVWHTAAASWNLDAGGAVFHMWIDDADATSSGNLNAGVIDYDRGVNWTFSSQSDGSHSAKQSGCLAEFLFHDDFIDLSVEANRRKVMDAAGKPVNKGTDGSLVFGVQPRIYLKNGDASVNTGSAPSATFNGTKTTCSNSPTD